MARYRYIGDCAKGEVVFTKEGVSVVMPKDVAVDVPDWLAAKLANNNHFEAGDAPAEKPKKGKAAK